MGVGPSRAQGAATLRTRIGEDIWSYVEAAEDAGYLKQSQVCGIPCLVPAYFCKKDPEPALQDLPEFKSPDGVTMGQLPIIYQSTVEGLKFRIHESQIAAFLLDNGIRMMTGAEEMEKHLYQNLSTILPVLDCRCIAKYSISGKTQVATLGGKSDGLKPGDAKFRIRIDEDFVNYAKDPAGYENKVKSAILEAMGLDAEKYPAAKHHIKIKTVEPGSVVVFLIIGACVLAAAGITALLGAWYRRSAPSSPKSPESSSNTTTLPPFCLTTTPNSSRLRRQVANISLTTSSEGSFEITGHFVPARKCYLRNTLFQKSFGEYVEAHRLQVGSEVLGRMTNNEISKMQVMSKVEHGRCMRNLVTLHTAQATLTITADHRVAIIGDTGIRTEAEARTLRRGMQVYVGDRTQELTRVTKYSSNVEAGSDLCTVSS